MAIQFPSGATQGQTTVTGGQTWLYDGTAWVVIPSGATGATGATGANLSAVNSSILPASTLVYDLGSITRRWRDLYLSGNTIDLGGALITSSNNAVILPAGSQIGNVTIGSGGATVTVGNTIPTTTTEGSLWLDSDTGDLRVYFGGDWAGVGFGPQGATGPIGATGPAGINTAYTFDGGTPTTVYTQGPAFDCGGVN